MLQSPMSTIGKAEPSGALYSLISTRVQLNRVVANASRSPARRGHQRGTRRQCSSNDAPNLPRDDGRRSPRVREAVHGEVHACRPSIWPSLRLPFRSVCRPSLEAVGFLLSFAWGFFGHSRWTFPAEGRDVRVALQRLAVASMVGFALNEAAYAGALRWTSLDYWLSLFLVILALAGAKLRCEQVLGLRARLNAARGP